MKEQPPKPPFVDQRTKKHVAASFALFWVCLLFLLYFLPPLPVSGWLVAGVVAWLMGLVWELAGKKWKNNHISAPDLFWNSVGIITGILIYLIFN